MGTTLACRKLWGRDFRGRTGLGLPASNPPHVNVQKVRSSVISHAAALQAERRLAQFGGWNPRQANVNRFSLHVETMLCYSGTGAARAQIFVAPRCPIAADHVDLAPCILNRVGEVGQQVE